MNNEIYRGIVVSAMDSPDGETPTIVIVTEENNGWGIFLSGHNEGIKLKTWVSYSRDRAIEQAIDLKNTLKEKNLAGMEMEREKANG